MFHKTVLEWNLESIKSYLSQTTPTASIFARNLLKFGSAYAAGEISLSYVSANEHNYILFPVSNLHLTRCNRSTGYAFADFCMNSSATIFFVWKQVNIKSIDWISRISEMDVVIKFKLLIWWLNVCFKLKGIERENQQIWVKNVKAKKYRRQFIFICWSWMILCNVITLLAILINIRID